MSDRGKDIVNRLNPWRVLPGFGLVLSLSCAQLGASVAMKMIASIGVSGTLALRLGFAAIVLSMMLRPWQVGWRSLKDAGPSLILYGLSIVTTSLSFYLALRTVPLGVLTALQFCGPLSVALIGSRRLVDFLWVGLAVAGLGLLLPLQGAHSVDPAGAAFALLSGAAWAAYIVAGRHTSARLHRASHMPALGALIAASIVVPAGIIQAGTELLHPAVLAAGLGVALMSSAIPYLLEAKVMSLVSPRAFGTLASLGPATGALIGFVVMGQRLGPHEWSGIAAIVAASIGTSLTSKPPHVEPA